MSGYRKFPLTTPNPKKGGKRTENQRSHLKNKFFYSSYSSFSFNNLGLQWGNVVLVTLLPIKEVMLRAYMFRDMGLKVNEA